MRIVHTKVVTTLAFSLLTAISMAAVRPAAAQTENHGVVKNLNSTVRLGGYFPTNSTVKSIGNTIICVGLDTILSRSSGVERTIASVDYISKSNGGSKLQMIPVTIGQITTRQSEDLTRTNIYFGYGVGLYFTQLDVPDVSGMMQQSNKTLYGGYLNVGCNLSSRVLLDARYHITTTSGPANPGGLELTVGVSF